MAARALLLVAFAAVCGFALAGEGLVLGFLRAAPEVAPVEDELPAASSAPTPEIHPARQAIESRPIHDPSNPDFHRLQRIDDATHGMPRDAVGFPDWMSALRSGTINPRAGLDASERMQLFDLDVVMRNTREMPHVRFPHLSHTMWLDCSNCHPAPFIPKAGANVITMSEIFRGRFCGMCHDRVAFITFFSCDRCHSVPLEKAGNGSPKTPQAK